MALFRNDEKLDIPTTDILSWIFSDQKYDQDEPIYIDAANPTRTISSRQARGIIRNLMAGLRAWGVKPGDCVCVHSFNDIYFSMLFLGIIGMGGVFAGSNPAYTTYELTHHIKTAQVKFLITEPEMVQNIVAAAKQCEIPETNILIFDVMGQKVPPGFSSWTRLLEHGEVDWVKFDSETQSKATTAARLFSSGTTGLPKAAIQTHYNFIAEHTLVFEANPKSFPIRRLHILPEFHAAAAPLVHTAPLRSGYVSFVMRRFELEPYLANVERYKITEVFMVPPVVISIVMSPLSKSYSLQSIKHVSCGAAPLDRFTQARFKRLLDPDARVLQVWGMTEATCIATTFRWPEDDTTGSVGRLVPGMEAKLIDDVGKDVSAYGVRGEICLRGPVVIPGYFGNPAASADAFTSDGWYKTGDIGYCDKQTQKWYIVDRKKELIKVRGFQVAPLEIEGVLLGHPAISDAAVIGVYASHKDGELPRAYVVRRAGSEGNLTEAEVRRYMSEKLAKYKDLTGGVRFVDAIPKNATGKILKRVLKEEAQAEIKLRSQL